MSRRGLAGLLGAALIVASILVDDSRPQRGPGSVALRLLGPLAELAARVQWVRVRAAMLDGRSDLALARGRTALELDPGDTQGWTMLFLYLSLERGSLQREHDRARRLAWLRAGLDLARRGEASAREPSELALWSGLVLSQYAREDEPLDWPGGAAGLWTSAALEFERAALLGHPDGEELARSARARASDLGKLPVHR